MDNIRKKKEKLIIKLYKKGKAAREIAQIVHVSFREISRVVRKLNGEKEFKIESNQSKAFRMFLAGKPIIKVAISLDLGYEEVKL